MCMLQHANQTLPWLLYSQGVTYTAVSAAFAEPRPATQVLPEMTVPHRKMQSILPNDSDSADE